MRPKQIRQTQRFFQSILLKFRWLIPGIGIKRWILLILVGTTLLGLGFAFLLLHVYRTAPESWLLPIIKFTSLQFIPIRIVRALIFGGIGITVIVVGVIGLNQALLKPFLRPGKNLVDTVTEYRRRDKGPRIVVIGGGTGLSAILRGLKEYSRNITAVVTVADDGGSSGAIRRSIGILPPGDFRNCLAALSNDEQLLTQLFQYRFASGAGLQGHSLGNLLISALTEITGSFEEAIAETARVLAVQGQVLPSTVKSVNLVADVQLPGKKVEIAIKGESQIGKIGGKIRRVWLEPANPAVFPPTVQAILNADMILIGPGSLYTSLIANLLVPDLVAAIKASKACKFYICNVASEPGETDDYSCEEHVQVIEKYIGGRFFDLILCNRRFEGVLPKGVHWVKVNETETEHPLYQTDLIDIDNPWRHDSAKVAKTVMDLFLERTGPLSSKEDNSSL
ncbi:MAG: YvcK family protein [Chloroflexi bacterium]|nr:YvcK family protein [Chloroflexota bacterium]